MRGTATVLGERVICWQKRGTLQKSEQILCLSDQSRMATDNKADILYFLREGKEIQDQAGIMSGIIGDPDVTWCKNWPNSTTQKSEERIKKRWRFRKEGDAVLVDPIYWKFSLQIWYLKWNRDLIKGNGRFSVDLNGARILQVTLEWWCVLNAVFPSFHVRCLTSFLCFGSPALNSLNNILFDGGMNTACFSDSIVIVTDHFCLWHVIDIFN